MSYSDRCEFPTYVFVVLIPFSLNRKYDVSKYKTPETHYPFYDAYHKSAAAVLAISNGENSIQGGKLDKYLKETVEFTPADVRPSGPSLPTYLQELMKLQTEYGKFENLESVCRIFSMPPLGVEHMLGLLEWEFTTAMVVAIFRQHNEYFDLLRLSYDQAMIWAPSNQVVYRAREIFLENQNTWNYGTHCETEHNEHQEAQLKYLSTSDAIEESESDMSGPGNISIENPFESLQLMLGSPQHRTPTPGTQRSFSASLEEKLRAITPHKDKIRIQSCQQRIDLVEHQIIRLMVDLETSHAAVMDCLARCTQFYNDAVTVAEKNVAFEGRLKLTLILL